MSFDPSRESSRPFGPTATYDTPTARGVSPSPHDGAGSDGRAPLAAAPTRWSTLTRGATVPEQLATACVAFAGASIVGSIAVWARTRGADTPEERAHAERFGIFVGLWAPTFMALADYLRQLQPGTGGRPAA